MKILLLADSNSSHTIKWVKALSAKGIQIFIFGLQSLQHKDFEELPNVRCYSLNTKLNKKEGTLSKLSYLQALPSIKKLIKEVNPDIVHAHYASSYGLLGALCGFKPYVLSVWGSDVFSFPKKSFLHKILLKYNLNQADALLSTSETMALESKKYTEKEIHITPFGVDLHKFSMKSEEGNKRIIGTVKSLEHKYGIDILIKAFALLRSEFENVELHIVGDGSDKENLLALTNTLGLADYVKFFGKISNDQVPEFLHSFSIYAALSRCEESFGVAIVEAQACGTPVVVSRMGGLTEVVADTKTGLVVSNENIEEASAAFRLLLGDDALRKKLALAARANVEAKYSWQKNVGAMVKIYEKLIS
ncbi:MAG: glycosyltransferase [Chitinophagales bacterium]